MNYQKIMEISLPKKIDAKAEAWWISPQGEILSIKNGERHIHKVIENPEAFGLTLEEIETAYKKHGEQLGTEHAAREELMLLIMEKGWIRIRNYKSFYSATLTKLGKRQKDYLFDWAAEMQNWDGPMKQVKIDLPSGQQYFTLGDITGGCFWDDLKESIKFRLKVIDSVFDFS